MIEQAFELLVRGARLPMAFSHFAVKPIIYIYESSGGYPELVRDPTREERNSMWSVFM